MDSKQETMGTSAMPECGRKEGYLPFGTLFPGEQLETEGKGLYYVTFGKPEGKPVLLLHGMSFTSKTWEGIDTPSLLASRGYYVIAVDLPGFGRSGGQRKQFCGELVAAVTKALSLQMLPAVVAPSFSGLYKLHGVSWLIVLLFPRYMFPALFSSPPSVSAAVPVASVGMREHTRELSSAPQQRQQQLPPVLVVWGSEDRLIPPSVSSGFAAAARKAAERVETLELSGAGHACYLDKPKEFHDGLLAFLESLRFRATHADAAPPKL